MKRQASRPTRNRRRIALTLFAGIALASSLIRLSRPDFNLLPVLLPLDVYGTSPNFFVGLTPVLFAFMSRDRIDMGYCLKAACAGTAGICLYELVQLWMPSRTFHFGDILATIVGATCSLAIAFVYLSSRDGL